MKIFILIIQCACKNTIYSTHLYENEWNERINKKKWWYIQTQFGGFAFVIVYACIFTSGKQNNKNPIWNIIKYKGNDTLRQGFKIVSVASSCLLHYINGVWSAEFLFLIVSTPLTNCNLYTYHKYHDSSHNNLVLMAVMFPFVSFFNVVSVFGCVVFILCQFLYVVAILGFFFILSSLPTKIVVFLHLSRTHFSAFLIIMFTISSLLARILFKYSVNNYCWLIDAHFVWYDWLIRSTVLNRLKYPNWPNKQ